MSTLKLDTPLDFALTDADWNVDLVFCAGDEATIEDWTGSDVRLTMLKRGGGSIEYSVGNGILAPTANLNAGIRVPKASMASMAAGIYDCELRRIDTSDAVDAPLIFVVRVFAGFSDLAAQGLALTGSIAGRSDGSVKVVRGASGLRVVRGAGAKGDAGTPIALLMPAAVPLGGHRIVKAMGDGTVGYPSSDAPIDAQLLLGMTTGATPTIGGLAEIQTGGNANELSWTWFPGPIFCGDQGVMTQAVPEGAWLRQVGVAIGPTSIIIDLNPVVLL
jgi:hypothetical protein